MFQYLLLITLLVLSCGQDTQMPSTGNKYDYQYPPTYCTPCASTVEPEVNLYVCHKHHKTLLIKKSEAYGHWKHGDYLGECE